MYTIDRINRIRASLGMTSLSSLTGARSEKNLVLLVGADRDVHALEVFCGIHPWVEVNVYKRAVHDYVGRRLHRLEVHCGIVPFDSPKCVCRPLTNERCICGSRRQPRHIGAGADLSGAHTFWLGADGAQCREDCGCNKCCDADPLMSPGVDD